MRICGNKICNVCLELVAQDKLKCPRCKNEISYNKTIVEGNGKLGVYIFKEL
jgi:hypothetical protein